MNRAPVATIESTESVPLSQRFNIQVFHKQRLDFSEGFDAAVELGRQKRPEETPFVKQRDGDGWRIVIARLDEPLISRRHIRLEPLSANRIRVSNVSDRNTIRVDGGGQIAARQSSDLPLPLSLVIGDKTIRVEYPDMPDLDAAELQSLAQPTLAPGSVAKLSTTGTLNFRSATKEAGESFVTWLQAVTAMLQSSASPKEYFEKAALAIVELIALDTGAVLVREEGRWNVVECRTGKRGVPLREWGPSYRILTSVANQKRTFWHIPGQALSPTASLEGIQAVVAAPILTLQGEVIGVLYGERLPTETGDTPISKLEAMLVETLACGVAAGLARIEQERKIVAAQVRFEQFFTPELSQQLAVQPDLLQGRDAEVTIMFCDIRGFSRISERLGPAATVEWIGSVLNVLSDCVIAHQGVLVDYIGDELMAMWGSPVEQPDHAKLACRAAIDMGRKLPELNERWQPVLKEPLRLGIGINTGMARVGNTGSNRKFKYGPLGNTVNLASRVQGATKYLKSDLLVTAATRERLSADFHLRCICQVRVVNISEPVELYELGSAPTTVWESLCGQYEKALQLFYRQNFRQAAKILGNILDEHPDDGPSLLLLSRAVERLLNPAGEFKREWDLPGK